VCCLWMSCVIFRLSKSIEDNDKSWISELTCARELVDLAFEFKVSIILNHAIRKRRGKYEKLRLVLFSLLSWRWIIDFLFDFRWHSHIETYWFFFMCSWLLFFPDKLKKLSKSILIRFKARTYFEVAWNCHHEWRGFKATTSVTLQQ
jgi:hypothetical protein